MGLGTTLLLSNTISGATTWTLPSASFSGTQYLGPPIAPTNAGDSTGFEIDPAATLYISFEGTYGTQTVVHEETLDSSGLTGWFPVVGYAVDGSSSGSGVSTPGVCYAFQVAGVRHRIRVTALGSGTLACRAAIGSHGAVVVGDTATPGTPGPTATGNITNTQSVTLTLGSPNYSTFGYSISGTWTGLIVVEGTVDGTNWTATTAVPLNGTAVGAFTANSIGQGNPAGLAGIRFRGNTVTSGTAVVTLVASEGVSTVMQDNLDWSMNLDQVKGQSVKNDGAGGQLVGSIQAEFNNALTVTSGSAYASGNSVGGLITIANAVLTPGTGLLQRVAINFKSSQTAQYDVVIFKANPTGTTITDKTAFSLATADFDKVAAVVHCTDATNLGTPSVIQANALAIALKGSTTTLYAAVITRGTPTFTATTDVSVSVQIIQD